MPFGKKKPHGFSKPNASKSIPEVNFDQIYEHLFMPALHKAGYEVARADSEPIAGDIRTDMFFELMCRVATSIPTRTSASTRSPPICTLCLFTSSAIDRILREQPRRKAR